MTVAQIAKQLILGNEVEGWTLSGDILSNGKDFYTVHYDGYRAFVQETVNPGTLPLIKKYGPIPDFYKRICRDCGAQFVMSKFHAGKERCNACEKLWRQKTGQDRCKVCLRCGKEFYISKFKPYLDPQYCPACSAVLRAREKKKQRKIEGRLKNGK